jgi:hypothetical protein
MAAKGRLPAAAGFFEKHLPLMRGAVRNAHSHENGYAVFVVSRMAVSFRIAAILEAAARNRPQRNRFRGAVPAWMAGAINTWRVIYDN